MGGKQFRADGLRGFFIACLAIASLLISGCSQFQVRSTFQEADDFFSRGNYQASLNKYEQIMENHPSERDRALFEMGIVYAYPGNELGDKRKALECFQKIVRDYPQSNYRYESERMIFHINNVTEKDEKIAEQRKLIEALQQEMKCKEDEILALQKRIEALEQRDFCLDKGPADMILIKKKERCLSLLSKGQVLKTYRIALGGNPNGPKERAGDNKTPEGTYFVDSRNLDSSYHISLHISYPNEKDKNRARKRGVSPGGDIMIHGIKNGYASVGEQHAEFDWTQGCIAVTDEEIEEIEKLVPNGTIVEIRP